MVAARTGFHSCYRNCTTNSAVKW